MISLQEEEGLSILQQEINLRTQLEALKMEKTQRMLQLKLLLEQDQDLCDVLCSKPYGIAPDSVPSLEQLENFQQHISHQNKEKVGSLILDIVLCQRPNVFVCGVGNI